MNKGRRTSNATSWEQLGLQGRRAWSCWYYRTFKLVYMLRLVVNYGSFLGWWIVGFLHHSSPEISPALSITINWIVSPQFCRYAVLLWPRSWRLWITTCKAKSHDGGRRAGAAATKLISYDIYGRLVGELLQTTLAVCLTNLALFQSCFILMWCNVLYDLCSINRTTH